MLIQEKTGENANKKLKIIIMFLTPHAATGLYLGSQVNNVWLAFILGIMSHLILDMIPHGDKNFADNWPRKTKIIRLSIIAAIDLVGIIFMCYILIFNNFISLTPSILAALVGSILPDFIWGFHEVTRDKISGWIASNILSWFHDLLPDKASLIKILSVQLSVLAIFIYLLIK